MQGILVFNSGRWNREPSPGFEIVMNRGIYQRIPSNNDIKNEDLEKEEDDE